MDSKILYMLIISSIVLLTSFMSFSLLVITLVNEPMFNVKDNNKVSFTLGKHTSTCPSLYNVVITYNSQKLPFRKYIDCNITPKVCYYYNDNIYFEQELHLNPDLIIAIIINLLAVFLSVWGIRWSIFYAKKDRSSSDSDESLDIDISTIESPSLTNDFSNIINSSNHRETLPPTYSQAVGIPHSRTTEQNRTSIVPYSKAIRQGRTSMVPINI